MRRLDVLVMVLCVGALGGVAWGEEAKPDISLEEAEAWGRRLATAVTTGDWDYVEGALDKKGFLERSTEGVGFSDEKRRAMVQSSMSKPLGVEIFGRARGGPCTYLSARHEDGVCRVWYRIIPSDGGFEYYEMLLARGEDGLIRATDYVWGLTGELGTESRRATWLGILAHERPSIRNGLEGRMKAYVESREVMSRIEELSQRGEKLEALRLFANLPIEQQSHPQNVFSGLNLAREVHPASVDAVYNGYARLNRGDISVDMLAMLHYQHEKSYRAMQAAVDRLDERVGGDPYLDVIRGHGYRAAGELDTARKRYLSAIEREPTLVEPHTALLEMGLVGEDYALVAEMLTALDKLMPGKIRDVRQYSAYAGFVLSAEGKRWLKDRGYTSAVAVNPSRVERVQRARPIALKEAELWGKMFAKDVELGRFESVRRQFDFVALAERAIEGMSLRPAVRHGLIEGMREGDLTQQIFHTDGLGSYRFMKAEYKGGMIIVRFRVLHPENGLNYHDLIVERGDRGEIRVVDMIPAASGELASSSLRRIWMAMLVREDRSLLDRIRGKDRAWLDDTEGILRMTDFNRAGEYEKVLKEYDALPKSIREMKGMMLLAIGAAGAADDARYLALLNRYAALFAGDPSLELILIDKYILEESYEKALRGIDRLDQIVGGDPYLDTMRATVLYMMGDLERAKRAARRSTAREPDLAEGYDILAMIGLEEEDWGLVAEMMTVMVRQLRFEFVDLRTLPEYAGFVGSDEGKRWLAEFQPAGAE